ncbi:polyketide synthase-like protein [Lindgomyces ingoldianus]|uniref:Polyketide synthase-like protein n=1 Tax=Lindgomyces ingoldianus TaxID=673940 RepID=A0ACB6QE46_9PLEO|nr:polyketide synthase-like protein [Lindgomyces ingoldianus]KAF2464420.1 polyketide synthase-like protein [Lindgomyces ingoldianus]
MEAPANSSVPKPLAIVGMSCRMPGAVASLEDFWEMLTNSKDGYKEFPSDRFNWKAFYHPNQARKDSIHVNHGYFLDGDITSFDAQFFKMNATDATSFDPQGRIVLECVYEALEDAGMPRESVAGTKVGVFSTANSSDYTIEVKDSLCSMPAQVGVLGHSCMLSNVVSNVFDLTGPSVTVDTACSSAFYALQMAAQSIRSGETDMCIVSGCALNISPWRWNMLSNLTMLNAEGKTAALDPNTDSGYARGEGGACIILKSLDLAQRDNDRIHCVLSHIGVNHNGHTNGYTMPDSRLQARLMTELQASTGILPDEFGFIEAHAPGTRVGDPIEVKAIREVFSSSARTPEKPLWMGSVKGNVGHLESASGFPSLIKGAMMLKKKFVVPNANFKSDEAKNVELRKMNFAVPTETRPWPKDKSYVAINNYGFGGSNAHCIIKMAPEPVYTNGVNETTDDVDSSEEDPFLFVLSANDETALARTREQLVEFLETDDAIEGRVSMRNLAYTLCERRSQLSWRSSIVASGLDDLAIKTASPQVQQRRVVHHPRVAFAFTGQGAQSFGMGRELFGYPAFAESLKKSSACVESFGATFNLLEELYGDEKTSRINDADVSQAASTAVQIALVDLLRSWEVEPTAVVGHSSGEVAAAYGGGFLTLPGAMRIAYSRGQMGVRLKQEQPDFKGGMMVISAGVEDVVPLLDIVTSGTVVIACENSQKSITVSGEDAALDELETLLEEDGVPHKRLTVDFPYHSPFLEPFVDRYEEDIYMAEFFPDTQHKVEFFSAMAGRRIDPAAVKKPSYWASSAKFRVRFTSAITALLKSKTPPEVIVEIGSNPTLIWAIKSIMKGLRAQVRQPPETLPTLQRGENARLSMLKLAGSLYSLGQRLNLAQVNLVAGGHPGRPHLVDGIRPYPWTRSRYWIESKIRDDHLQRSFPRNDLLGYAMTRFSDGETSWFNNFELDDMPWLRDFQVGPFITFPLAGFVCTALEASKQRTIAHSPGSDIEITGFSVRDVHLLHPLTLEEGVRIELASKLRPIPESDYQEFEMSTWSEAQQQWIHHCRALVKCHVAPEKVAVGTAEEAGGWSKVRRECKTRVGSALLYQGSAKTGPRRVGMFRNVHNLWFDSGKATAEVVVSDTETVMPNHYETDFYIHPTTLDGLIQCGSYLPFLDPTSAPAGSANSNVWVPTSVEEVNIVCGSSHKPGQKLQAVVRSEQSTQKREGGYFAIDATMANDANSSVQIRGLQLSVEERLPLQWPEPHYGCYKLAWQAPEKLSSDTTAKWHILQGPEGDNGLAGILSKKLGCAVVPMLQGLPAEAKFCVVVDVGEGLLGHIDEVGFDAVKHALSTCDGVVWVTRGAFFKATNPTAGMAVGLLRTVRSEMQASVATLDLDPFATSNAAAQVALVAKVASHVAAAAKKADSQAEMEFTESSGQLFVPRIVHDDELDANVHAATGVVPPRDEPFDPEIRGAFALQRPGVPQSLFLQRADTSSSSALPLAADEVEIAVAAASLSVADVQALQGRELGGTVVRCGSNVDRVQVGDRVFGLANTQGAFGTFVVARQTSIARVPEAFSLDVAATLPATFGAAHLALVDVGRIRTGERVVILEAGSAAGQAAIQVAKAVGADVYAVVASCEERDAVFAVAELPKNHVVGSLNDIPPAQAQLILQPVPKTKVDERDDARISRALAALGRFVQIGEWSRAPRLPAGCSAAAVSLNAVADVLPAQTASVLDAVTELFAKNSVKGPSSVNKVRLGQLHEALEQVSPLDTVRRVLVPEKGDTIRTTLPPPALPSLSPNAVYLVIGGGGGLGRVITRWMVDNGARKIGLLSRSTSMSPEVQTLVEKLATLGAEVFLLPCDATDKAQVQEVLDQCAADKGPIRGIINAAMVFRGGVFSSTSHADFGAVIRPKVMGTWNLHHALQNKPLDFFVLISSVAGIVGTPGHSAYAAANTFLDSFARYRTRQNLPAAALALTAVVDAGYMAENAEKLQKLKYVDDFEGEILTTSDVLSLLAAAVNGQLQSSCEGLSITGAGFGGASRLPAWAKDPRFSPLMTRHAKEQQSNAAVVANKSSLSNTIDSAENRAEATRLLLTAVRSKVAELQLIPVTDIKENNTLVDLGLDSLTAMELYSWIGRVFHLKFKVQEYAKLDTLEKIVDSVLTKREAAATA